MDFKQAPPDMPIPDRLNAALVATVFLGAIGLLWLGSRRDEWWWALGAGILFSYLMLMGYALLHEASHGNLQSTARRNYWLGLAAGAFFPMPLTLMRSTHQAHHDHNRTEVEMFDLYRPGEDRVRQTIRWYGILCGFFWPLVPLGAVFFCFAPRLFRKRRASGYLVGGIDESSIGKLRFETLGLVALFAVLFWALDLSWQNTLIMYACFAVNWSTRQYVGHAFSNRDVVEGAWNLQHNRLMSFLLLHSELDLTHHRHPEIPWLYLPRLKSAQEQRRGYIRQYWRQWLGPQPVK